MTKIVSMASCLLALASLGLLSAPAYAQGERSPEVDFFGDGRFRL